MFRVVARDFPKFVFGFLYYSMLNPMQVGFSGRINNTPTYVLKATFQKTSENLRRLKF